MTADRQGSDTTREFRLEGFTLVLCGAVLLALLLGAFFLGRRVERGASGAGSAVAKDAGPPAPTVTRAPDADVGRGQSYFDSLEGPEKQAEPGRELQERAGALPAARPEPPPSTPPSPAPASAALASEPTHDGSYFVQVSALRDERAASELIDALKAQGYGVRLFSEREGSGLLYKVRVGGYASEQGAREAATRLRAAGYSGAWVTSVD
jgi:cell division septation protein DedD